MWKRLQFPPPATSTAPVAASNSPIASSSEAGSSSSAPKHVLTKTCCCGAITLTVKDDNWSDGVARGHICFCYLCRQTTGSHFAHSIEVPISQVGIEGNDPAAKLSVYRVPGLTPGSVSRRFFCARCGAIVGGTAGHAPEVFMVRTGGFETVQVPPPARSFLAGQRVGWLRDKITERDVPDGDDMELWRVVGGS